MFDIILDGISIKLNSIFGNGYEIYSEDVKQGTKEPCFFIKALPVQNKPLLGKRKQRTYSFMITHLMKEGNQKLREAAEKMLDGLEYINLITGDVLRGYSLEAEIVDGNLQFSCKYDVFINAYEKKETMETVETKVETKGG